MRPSPAASSCSRARRTASLAFQSCVNTGGTAGCSQGRNLGEVSYGAVSPDGQTLVVGNEYDVPGIAIFNRDANGNLSQRRAATVACRPRARR